jgi:hypothetical protein
MLLSNHEYMVPLFAAHRPARPAPQEKMKLGLNEEEDLKVHVERHMMAANIEYNVPALAVRRSAWELAFT